MEISRYKFEEIITSINSGKTPSTKNPLYFEGDIPWVTPIDLKGQKHIVTTDRYLSEQAIEDKEAFLYKENTILISTVGDIGNVAIVQKPVASNQQITGVRVNENIVLPSFFYYWVIRNKEYLSFKANKAIIPLLNNRILKSIIVEIPADIEYQRKVSIQLDTIQDLIDKRIETIGVLEDLQQSIFFEMFGDVVNNQKSYKKRKLKNIVKKDRTISYGIVQAGPYVENGIPYIKSGDIKNGKITISELNKTSKIISDKYKKTICKEGDCILTIRATVGEVGIIDKNMEGINITRGTALLSPNENIVNSNYLHQLLLSDGFQFILKKHVKGATFKEINIAKLREIEVPIASLDIQNKYAILLQSINQQKLNLNLSLNVLQMLFQSVLQNTFKKDSVIDEAPIFKELLKKLSLEDLRGNKKRLQLLIDLFKQNKFDDDKSYSNAKEMLFDLILEKEIKQTFDADEIKLSV